MFSHRLVLSESSDEWYTVKIFTVILILMLPSENVSKASQMLSTRFSSVDWMVTCLIVILALCRCQFCGKATVPFLTVNVIDYRGQPMAEHMSSQESMLHGKAHTLNLGEHFL